MDILLCQLPPTVVMPRSAKTTWAATTPGSPGNPGTPTPVDRGVADAAALLIKSQSDPSEVAKASEDGEPADSDDDDGPAVDLSDENANDDHPLHEYCLQPAAIRRATPDDVVQMTDPGDKEREAVAEGDFLVQLCKACHSSLMRRRVPPASLVRVDTGPIPWMREGPDGPEIQLKPLSIFEELLLAPYRCLRYVGIMKPSGDRSLSQLSFRGHIIAFQNVGADEVAKVFPLRFEDIPQVMQVCLCNDCFLHMDSYPIGPSYTVTGHLGGSSFHAV